MESNRPFGCDDCADPLAITTTEREIRRINADVWIFRCPKCHTLILDDIKGWKGSGVIFHATEEMIDDYVRKNRPGGGGAGPWSLT